MKKETTYSHQNIDPILWYPITAKASDVPSCLKEWRIYRDFTLRQVEAKTGISNCYLSQLETGKTTNPSFAVIVKLCELYQVRLTI